MTGTEFNQQPPHLHAEILGSDVDAVTSAIADFVNKGHPIRAIEQMLAGTDWRYEITGSGTSIVVKARSDLMCLYEELLDQVREAAVAVVESGVTRNTTLQALEKRERLGRYCHMLSMECRRLYRYLYPNETGPDAKRDIEQCLLGTHLQWDGQYEVERFPGENALLFRRSQT